MSRKGFSCIDEKTGRYQNVEHFQPVLYDLDDPMPRYNPRWEVYRGSGKSKQLVRINWPAFYRSWWEKQIQRCYEGYEVGGVKLSGMNYFWLNFWPIKQKAIGAGWGLPRFIDVGKVVYDAIEKAKGVDRNLMVLKRRQLGLSEMMACAVGYHYTLFPGAECLILAGESEYSDNAFMKTKIGLDNFSRESEAATADAFYKRRTRDKGSELVSGFLADGVRFGFMSRIRAITLKGNIQRASGKSPVFVLCDEVGIMERPRAVNEMLLPSIQEGGLQNGRIIVWIGTGGEMDAGVGEMQIMYYKPDNYNLLAFDNVWDVSDSLKKGIDIDAGKCGLFLTATYYYVTDEDGNSYHDLGDFFIDLEHELRKNSPEDLHYYKTQMPRSPQEAFSISGLSPFDAIKLGEARARIMRNNWEDLVQYGRLDYITNEQGVVTGVEWKAADNVNAVDDEGDLLYPVMIWEHPQRPGGEQVELGQQLEKYQTLLTDVQYVNLYYGGTDSYDRDSTAESDSKGSISIFKGVMDDGISTATSMLFVARLTWRPSKAEKFFDMSLKLCIYYGCQNLCEWSNILIFGFYKNAGFEHLLKERPMLSQEVFKNSKQVNRYGIDPQTRPWWVTNFASYIKDYSENLYDLERVQRYIAFRLKKKGGKKYNDDVVDADMIAYQHFLDNKDRRFKVVRSDEGVSSAPLFGYTYDRSGRIVNLN